jgi:hypothetical protein
VFIVWITIVVMAVVIAVAKEFIDKSKWSKRSKLAWTALVAIVASAGAIFTVTRAISSEQAARKLADAAAAVEAKYAHRRLTADQELALKDALSKAPHPPSSAIQVHSVSGDPESAAFGIHLAEAIRAAGWPAEHENMAFFGAPHGLEIRCPGQMESRKEIADTDELSCPAATGLARALARAGQHARVAIMPATSMPESQIELVIGYKPLEQ